MSEIVRDTGQFPVSIGTSLALEGLFGIHPDQPRQPRWNKFSQVWINLETLVRNLYASMNKETLASPETNVSTAVTTILDELYEIQELLSQRSDGKMEMVTYYQAPEVIKWLYPHAQFRNPHTDRQQQLHNLETITTFSLITAIQEKGYPLRKIEKRPEFTSANVAILTHHVHHLFWRFQFQYFFLLESHTGKLKDPSHWSSKMKGVSNDDHLPFTPFTLQVFGDGNVFAGESRVVKREVKDLAKSRRWTKVTTTEKILNDITNYGSPALKEVYNKLMSRH